MPFNILTDASFTFRPTNQQILDSEKLIHHFSFLNQRGDLGFLNNIIYRRLSTFEENSFYVTNIIRITTYICILDQESAERFQQLYRYLTKNFRFDLFLHIFFAFLISISDFSLNVKTSPNFAT